MARHGGKNRTGLRRKANRLSGEGNCVIRNTEGSYIAVDSSDGGRGQLREGTLRSLTAETVPFGRQVDNLVRLAKKIPPLRDGGVHGDNN